MVDNSSASWVAIANQTESLCSSHLNDHARFLINGLGVGLLCLFGLAGNVLSMCVLACDKTNNVAIFLLKCLAVADNCLLTFAFFYMSLWYGFAYYLEKTLGLGYGVYDTVVPYKAVFVDPLGPICQSLVIWITVLLAVNRYIVVCQPLKAARLCTMSNVKKQVVAVVLSVIVFHIPAYCMRYLTWERDPRSNKTRVVAEPVTGSDYLTLVHTDVLSAVFVHILPFVILLVLNIKVTRALKRFRMRCSQRGSSLRSDSNMQQSEVAGRTEANISRVMTAVILVFLVCQGPDRLYQIRPITRCVQCHAPWLESLFNLLVILNSSVNFLIYFFMRQSFRKIFMRKFCGGGRSSARDGVDFKANCGGSPLVPRNV